MGDSLDDMIALSRLRKDEAKARKIANLSAANTEGWEQLSTHHFRRRLVGGGHIDWWPSTQKFVMLGMGVHPSRARYRHGDPNAFAARKGKEWLA